MIQRAEAVNCQLMHKIYKRIRRSGFSAFSLFFPFRFTNPNDERIIDVLSITNTIKAIVWLYFLLIYLDIFWVTLLSLLPLCVTAAAFSINIAEREKMHEKPNGNKKIIEVKYLD